MKWRWIIQYSGSPPRIHHDTSHEWATVLGRYIAASDKWTLDQVTPKVITFVGRGAWQGCIAIFEISQK